MDGRVPAAEVEVPVAAPVGSEGFQHAALLHRSETEYLTEVAAFLQAALARGEPALAAVPAFRMGPLTDALGADAQRVVFVDMAVAGRNPGRVISAVRAFAESHPGRRVSAVGEPTWPARSAAELVEAARHEALSNLAFARTPMTALCPYDVTVLPAEVAAAAEQTHPLLAGPGGPAPSPAYLGPDAVPAACLAPLPEPPPDAEVLRYRTDLRAVRHVTGTWAERAGLPPGRAADLVIAVSELAANTLRHTQGAGLLRIWCEPAELVCDISDQGWISDPLAGRHRPAPDEPGGHGLWLVHEVCDLVEVRTSATGGTITRLHMQLPG